MTTTDHRAGKFEAKFFDKVNCGAFYVIDWLHLLAIIVYPLRRRDLKKRH